MEQEAGERAVRAVSAVTRAGGEVSVSGSTSAACLPRGEGGSARKVAAAGAAAGAQERARAGTECRQEARVQRWCLSGRSEAVARVRMS